MADFNTFWNGTPPTASVTGYSPWIRSPGYDFSSTLYSYLTGMIGQQAPRWRSPYGGQGGAAAGPAIAPEMQALMQLGKQYMNTGMPTTFGTGLSSLGRFLAPSFTNPYARMQQGYPDYFGAAAMGGGGMNPMANPWSSGMYNPNAGYGGPAPMPQQQMPMRTVPPQYQAGPSTGFRYDPNQQQIPGNLY